MEFHQTRAGRTFFEHTLPKLIDSMDDLTNAIKDNNKVKAPLEEECDFNKPVEITIVADVEGINSPNIEQSLDNEISSLFAELGGEVIDIKPYTNHKE